MYIIIINWPLYKFSHFLFVATRPRCLESCWILWERASNLNVLDYHVDFWGGPSELLVTVWTGYYYKESQYKQAFYLSK